MKAEKEGRVKRRARKKTGTRETSGRKAAMTRASLLKFMRSQRLVVQTSVTPAGSPQAAIVGIVVSDRFEYFFDTLSASRKVINLRRNPRIAFVIGGKESDESTVQYEGIADEPSGSDLERLKKIYFKRFPGGVDRQRWPGLTYLRARPAWIRFSDFNRNPPEIVEFRFGRPVAGAAPSGGGRR